MDKRLQVRRFLFETAAGAELCRHMLTDRLIPMLIPNQYIEMKSINKPSTGKVYAQRLCVFFNFLDQQYSMTYENASNKQVLAFLDYLVYGERAREQIASVESVRTYSTLTGYVSAITDFYRWLDQVYGSEMEFYEMDRACRSQSFLYGQIFN